MTSNPLRAFLVVFSMLVLGCESSPNDSEPNDPAASGGAAGGDMLGVGSAGTGAPGGNQQGSAGHAGNGSSGGSSGGAGHLESTGGGGMSNGKAADAGSVAPPTCASPPNSVPPTGAVALSPGVWKDITPAELVAHEGDNAFVIGQGLAMDPCNPFTLYWGNTPFQSANGGLFKSTNGGASWARVAKVTPAFQGAADHLDEPLHVRIDPKNTQHLYAGDGVRGGSQGFFVSMDGGATFVKPQGLTDATRAAAIDNQDIYDVAVDPVDFAHVLISFHYRWGWTDTKWNTSSGVMESKDGGDTWTVHDPVMGWGSGHAIKFLYDPVLGLGDSATWLLGTQEDGYWRTTDSGKSWTKVSDNRLQHGGGTIYYNSKGILFATGSPSNMRSSDNGVSWTLGGPGNSTAVFGDGELLWTSPVWGDGPILTSPENDGVSWTPYKNGAQTFHAGGPFEIVFDSANRILYASMWMAGVWALKLP